MWPEIAFASDIIVKAVISFLTTLFSREGYPEEIVSDNGPQLISHEFEEFLRIRNIKHTFSAVLNSDVLRLYSSNALFAIKV